MPRVTDPTKRVTDPVALAHLNRQGKVADNWEFWHDYGSHNDAQGRKRKEFSPYAKFYRNTDNPSERMMVVSGLPMVDADGVRCEPQWIQAGQTYRIKRNVFDALYNDQTGMMTLTCKNDQPDRVQKKNDKVSFSPQLFVSDVEIPKPPVSLLPIDPKNPNYAENVLEWDYGDIKRWVRTVEGRYHGYWLRPVTFNQPMRMVYNQSGEYRLRLSQEWAVSDDIEEVPATISQPDSAQTIVYQGITYYLISDSATYYPDANPETTSVDGSVGRGPVSGGETWAAIRSGAGEQWHDDLASLAQAINMNAAGAADLWSQLWRSIFLFDSSGLPDTADISVAVLSLRGYAKADNNNIAPDIAIYTSIPASNTSIVAADYGQTGSTVQSDVITYAAFNASGYNDFTLNATGRGNVSKTGVSKFAARNANYDVANISPPHSNDADARFSLYFSEQGNGFKPKLVVTYTITMPAVSTMAATNKTDVAARLNGLLTNIGEGGCTVRFQYGLTEAYGTNTAWVAQGVGTFFADISGLTAGGTTYHFRAQVTNAEGTVSGGDLTFKTAETVYPTYAITRVTSLTHRYYKGKQGGFYNLEIGLGDLTADFSIPEITTPQKSYEPSKGGGTTSWDVPSIFPVPPEQPGWNRPTPTRQEVEQDPYLLLEYTARQAQEAIRVRESKEQIQTEEVKPTGLQTTSSGIGAGFVPEIPHTGQLLWTKTMKLAKSIRNLFNSQNPFNRRG